MNLGIVGHGADKFTYETFKAAFCAIGDAIERTGATCIVSGHSPLGGVDLWAEDAAAELGLRTVIHAPKRRTWSGPGGFKQRNLAIARDSDLVLVVVVQELPQGYTGMRFASCYHCRGRNPSHVKSGGCWTAWKARAREWIIL